MTRTAFARPSTLALAGAALALALLPAAARADRGGSSPAPLPQRSPAEEASDHLRRGLSFLDKADELKAEGPAADEKRQGKIDKLYRRAAGEFRTATQKDSRMHQAWNGLGYALRSGGDYTGALAAYDRALAIAPNYHEAIEYRGQAYLHLGRLDDAKAAYLSLFAGAPALADTLLGAMKTWVAEQRTSPGANDPAAIDSFATWVAERESVAGTTRSATATATPSRRW